MALGALAWLPVWVAWSALGSGQAVQLLCAASVLDPLATLLQLLLLLPSPPPLPVRRCTESVAHPWCALKRWTPLVMGLCAAVLLTAALALLAMQCDPAFAVSSSSSSSTGGREPAWSRLRLVLALCGYLWSVTVSHVVLPLAGWSKHEPHAAATTVRRPCSPPPPPPPSWPCRCCKWCWHEPDEAADEDEDDVRAGTLALTEWSRLPTAAMFESSLDAVAPLPRCADTEAVALEALPEMDADVEL